MAVRRKQVRSITVISLKGSFFGDKETDELQKAIMDEAATGNTRLVLDLSDCEAMNSIAIGVLMRGYTNYKGRGGEIKLCGLGKRMKSIFVDDQADHAVRSPRHRGAGARGVRGRDGRLTDRDISRCAREGARRDRRRARIARGQ